MMNVRHGLAALFLAAGLLTITACGSLQAGTAVGVAQVGSVSSTPTTSSSASSSSDTPASSSAAEPTTSASPATTEEGDATPTTSGSSSGSVQLDEVTQHWVTGMCTDMGALLATVFDVPKANEKSPVAEYRQAFIDYYTHIAQAAQTALDDASGATPPNVTNGAAIHQVFLRYLTGLADIAGSGATLLQKETKAADISADIKQINNEIQDLGNGDSGLGNLSSPELEAAIKTVPACQNMVSQG